MELEHAMCFPLLGSRVDILSDVVSRLAVYLGSNTAAFSKLGQLRPFHVACGFRERRQTSLVHTFHSIYQRLLLSLSLD